MLDKIIEKKEGACIVLAGAGTGKTHAIVEKIKALVNNGVYKPEKIVCITFSNEAANNVALRVEKSLEMRSLEGAKKPVVRTFHGFSADLLREHGERIGIGKEFRILDSDQAKVILHRSLKVNPANCHKYINTIGTAKDLGITLEDFKIFLDVQIKSFHGIDMEKRLESLNFELQTMHLRKEQSKKRVIVAEIKKLRRIIDMRKFVNAWGAYEKIKQKGNYQDYSDLSNNVLLLLDKNPEIAEKFDYIIVDEFQDTNKIQLEFLEKLALKGNIMVVGDMNQSIYRFRGAYKDNFDLFKKKFSISEAEIFNLSKSYRSPNKVLRAAHKLISVNYQNKEECFFVENFHNREGEQISVFEMKDAKEEARKVVEIVKSEKEKGTEIEDICVVFRTHQHGRIIKKALEDEGIDFYSVSKASLMKQKSIKTAKDYLTIINKINRKERGGEDTWWDIMYQLDFPQDNLIKIGRAIKDFISKERKEGEKMADKVEESSDKESEEKAEKKEDTISSFLLENLENIVSDRGKIAAKMLISRIKEMLSLSGKKISEIVQEVYRVSGLLNEQRTREEKEIMLNLNKFYELTKTHEEIYDAELSNFLYYLEVLDSLGIEIDASELEAGGVRLMTSHATKGLEYKIVIITNMAQGRFPIERYSGSTLIPTELLPEVKGEIKGMSEEEKEDFIISYEKYNQLLEERRLCYVSFTRAKERLILTYAKEYGSKVFFPSAFLNEISFKNNPDISFSVDNEVKYSEKDEENEMKKVSYFHTAEQMEDSLENRDKEKEKKEKRKLSPSALILFDNCQKQFEYKYVYNMPERKTLSWEAMRLGSFVHLILEEGVSSGFSKVEDFLELAREKGMEEDWESVQLPEAETLIRVFFERHKGRYNEKTKTEQYLPLSLAGIEFIGFADRIDFREGVEIVDYKTGKSAVSPRDRNWQLGFYALAAQDKYGKVRKVILDMLKQERPIEFEIDDKGNALCLSSKYIDGFNIYEVREELIQTARKIQDCYKSSFKACSVEKNCDFCNEYVYNL